MSLVVVVLLSPVSLSCALYLLYPHPLLSIVQLAYSVLTWYRNCHLRLPLSHAFPCPTPILSLQAYSPPGLLCSAMLLLLYLTLLIMLNANVIICCMLCVDQAGPCLSHPYLCSVFALQDCPRSPNSSCTISHTCVQPSQSRAAHRVHTLSYLSCPYLCSALTSWHGCPPIQSTLPT